MNSVVNNPKTLSRLWAALSCDFESLLARFMGGIGWRYHHFAAYCRQMQITLILHITQGRGKTKDEHYNLITDMILQMCKDLWLRPFDNISRPDKSTENKDMELKRALGGFYLLYTMFEKQPIKDRVKIPLGICDMVGFNKFCVSVKGLDFGDEVIFMLHYLGAKEAFHYCLYAEEYRFDAPMRNFCNISRNEVVELTKRMRDTQDVLAYSDVHERSRRVFDELTVAKNKVSGNLLRTLDEENMAKHFNPESAFSLFAHTVNSDHLRKSMRKLDILLDKPVMTLEGLTATEAIDRRMMVETRRRMERARKKAQINTQPDAKTSRPYVREGGIFGRKKDTADIEDKVKRRERGACNGNLWVFINGQDFGKPMPLPDTSFPGGDDGLLDGDEGDDGFEDVEKKKEEAEVGEEEEGLDDYEQMDFGQDDDAILGDDIDHEELVGEPGEGPIQVGDMEF